MWKNSKFFTYADDTQYLIPWLSILPPQDLCGEVEVLMERMKQLQECRDDEEASQEEMATRFEREKTESMLVVTAEEDEAVPSRDISRHFEDPSYGYKDFSRRGEPVPTFRAQVESAAGHTNAKIRIPF